MYVQNYCHCSLLIRIMFGGTGRPGQGGEGQLTPPNFGPEVSKVMEMTPDYNFNMLETTCLHVS